MANCIQKGPNKKVSLFCLPVFVWRFRARQWGWNIKTAARDLLFFLSFFWIMCVFTPTLHNECVEWRWKIVALNVRLFTFFLSSFVACRWRYCCSYTCLIEIRSSDFIPLKLRAYYYYITLHVCPKEFGGNQNLIVHNRTQHSLVSVWCFRTRFTFLQNKWKCTRCNWPIWLVHMDYRISTKITIVS